MVCLLSRNRSRIGSHHDAPPGSPATHPKAQIILPACRAAAPLKMQPPTARKWALWPLPTQQGPYAGWPPWPPPGSSCIDLPWLPSAQRSFTCTKRREKRVSKARARHACDCARMHRAHLAACNPASQPEAQLRRVHKTSSKPRSGEAISARTSERARWGVSVGRVWPPEERRKRLHLASSHMERRPSRLTFLFGGRGFP